MKEIIGLLTVAVGLVAYVPYIRDILRGKTNPHPYSWFVWGFITSAIFALQISKGSGPGSYVTLTVMVLSFIIFFLGLKQGIKDITLFDTICLGISLVAIGFWLFAKQPVTSIILLVSIDVIGFMPTIRKSWQKPSEETLSLWGANALRHTLSIIAIKQYNVVTLLNPVVWALGNTFFSLFLIARRRTLARAKDAGTIPLP